MISFGEAKEILTPHLAAFYTVPHEAWKDFQREIPEKSKMVLSKRTRASAVHDFMVARAAEYAESVEGVRLFELKMLYGLIIDNIAIRFKKFDEFHLSSNHITKQVLNFRNQRQLEGISAIVNLEVGYSLDKHEREISQITLACPSGLKNNLWEVELDSSKTIELVQDIFDDSYEEYIPPAKFKPKKGEIVPFKKKLVGGKDDNDKEDKW